MLRILLFTMCLLAGNFATSQQVIELKNPSFEDAPHAGSIYGGEIKGWTDCGIEYFLNETPPDIHLGMEPDNEELVPFFAVRQPAAEGFTFLGLVVRDNETYEAVAQELSEPLQKGKCYEFSIDLARSLTYISPYSYNAPETNENSKKYTRPAVLRIYGSNTPCGKTQLLATSDPVKNSEWKQYDFFFTPEKTYHYFIISAFYEVPLLIPYNGNILLDNASDIVEIDCVDE